MEYMLRRGVMLLDVMRFRDDISCFLGRYEISL
jgi:hypothetical protein